jgi:hypothetical protein
MMAREKIKAAMEEDLQWLDKFAAKSITNVYKNDLVEVDRKISRISAFLEVLQESPDEGMKFIIDVLKKKLQRIKE